MRMNEVDLNSRDDIVFRFRKASSVINHNELRNLEIYFCPFDEEDDAAEGMLNLYWKGDEILWDNFIAHYFMVFYFHYVMLLFSDDDKRDVPESITWELSRSSFNMEGLIQQLLELESIKRIKAMIMSENHDVSSDELRYYLQMVHEAVLIVVWNINHSDVIDDKLSYNLNSIDMDKFVEALSTLKWDKANRDGMFRWMDQFLQMRKDKVIADNGTLQPWKKWLFFDFPLKYYDCLFEMIFPKWYVASFCTDCTSKRNWAHYADSSKGICLIHKKHNGPFGKGIKIKTCHQVNIGKSIRKGDDGRIFDNHIEPLIDVKYIDTFPRINFFEMTGHMTGAMIEEWYHDKDGNTSIYYVGDRGGLERNKWHEEYWKQFQRHVSSKTTDWENQKEQRVVLEDNIIMGCYRTYSDRHIKYEFDELEGIIWGSRMNEEEKNQIRETIKDLCTKNGRKNFAFYQAVIDPSDGRIWIEKEIHM